MGLGMTAFLGVLTILRNDRVAGICLKITWVGGGERDPKPWSPGTRKPLGFSLLSPFFDIFHDKEFSFVLKEKCSRPLNHFFALGSPALEEVSQINAQGHWSQPPLPGPPGSS